MLFQRMQCRAKQSEQQACKMQIINYKKSLNEKQTKADRCEFEYWVFFIKK